MVSLLVTAGYLFTSSTFFVNPVLTIARSFTDTFVGIYSGNIIGLGIYWAALLSFLQAKEKNHLVVNAILTFVTGIMAINSRSEASPYLLLVTVIIIFLHAPVRKLIRFLYKCIIDYDHINYLFYLY